MLITFPRDDASKFLPYGYRKRSIYQDIPKILPDVMGAIKLEIRMILFGICARISEKVSHKTDLYQSRKSVTVGLCAILIVPCARDHVTTCQANFH